MERKIEEIHLSTFEIWAKFTFPPTHFKTPTGCPWFWSF